jgi:hypothetical protein
MEMTVNFKKLCILPREEVLYLFSHYAYFLVSQREGRWTPLCNVPYYSGWYLHHVQYTLGYGRIMDWQPFEFQVQGTDDCRRLLEYLGDDLSLPEPHNDFYQKWREVVSYLATHPSPEKHELDPLLVGLNVPPPRSLR